MASPPFDTGILMLIVVRYSSSQMNSLRLLVAPNLSSEYDVEKATYSPLQISNEEQALEVGDTNAQYNRWYDDSVLVVKRLPAIETPKSRSLDNETPSVLPTATTTSRISDSEALKMVSCAWI